MGKIIDGDELIELLLSTAITDKQREYFECVQYAVQKMPTVDAGEVVRCRDCKHRPTGTDRNDLEFPDDKCPCQCEDYWYSWKPSDDWFCKNGERKDGEQHE